MYYLTDYMGRIYTTAETLAEAKKKAFEIEKRGSTVYGVVIRKKDSVFETYPIVYVKGELGDTRKIAHGPVIPETYGEKVGTVTTMKSGSMAYWPNKPGKDGHYHPQYVDKKKRKAKTPIQEMNEAFTESQKQIRM